MASTRARVVSATVVCLACLGLAACAQPTAGTATPASTSTSTASAVPSTTVVNPPPATVYAAPPATVTVPVPAKPLTPCQRMHADGYSYAMAFSEWERAGYPPNWDADHDGYPCEQSYGEMN